jgi:hypothetical protein
VIANPTGQADQPQISAEQSALTIPETKMPWPTFPTVQREWYRLRKRVARLANPIPWARDLGWCSVSLAGAAVLGLVGWIPVKAALSREAQFAFAWITGFLIWGVLATALIAFLAFTMYAKTEKVLRSDVEHLLEEMDEMHPAPSSEARRPGFFARTFQRLFGSAPPDGPSTTSTGDSSLGA